MTHPRQPNHKGRSLSVAERDGREREKRLVADKLRELRADFLRRDAERQARA